VYAYICVDSYVIGHTGDVGRRFEYVNGVKAGVLAWIRMDLYLSGDKFMDSRGFSSIH
jgi:hypothetical protein